MLDILDIAQVYEACERLLSLRRPPEELRVKVDLKYRIEDHSVLIYEIRQRWDRKDEYIESPIAKTTWVKSKNCWKIFWLRADLKWHGYKPKPVVGMIGEFVELVNEDKYGCFWG